MKCIQLSTNVSLPLLDFATQGNAVLGIRDSGKSYTATYLAEQLLEAGIPFVAFDPIGVWRYLKVPGKQSVGKGYPIVIAGEGGDIPLSAGNAAEIVRAAMHENVPIVIDLFGMQFSKTDWRKIVETCVNVLLYENKTLRHVFLEEAAQFCPQRIQPEMGRVYAAIEKLAQMGGNRHLGYTLINQRAEAVNKEVLELCDCLFLHRQRGKNSLLSLQKWLEVADASKAKELIASLPTLPQGECWVWAQSSSIPNRVRVPCKRSLHPDRRNPTHSVMPVAADVAPFVHRMKAFLSKAESAAPEANKPNQHRFDDVESLKRQVATLRTQLDELKNRPPVRVPVLSDEEITNLEAVSKALQSHGKNAIEISNNISSALTALKSKQPQPAKTTPPLVHAEAEKSSGVIKPGGGVRRMMIALAQRPGLNERQLGLRAGLSSKSGTFRNYMSLLRKNGWLARNGAGFTLTDEGFTALGSYSPLPTGSSLLAYWLSQLGRGPRAILGVLAKSYPSTLSKDDLAAQSEMSGNSGTFRNYLSELRGYELIVTLNGAVQASPELFD